MEKSVDAITVLRNNKVFESRFKIIMIKMFKAEADLTVKLAKLKRASHLHRPLPQTWKGPK